MMLFTWAQIITISIKNCYATNLPFRSIENAALGCFFLSACLTSSGGMDGVDDVGGGLILVGEGKMYPHSVPTGLAEGHLH